MEFIRALTSKMEEMSIQLNSMEKSLSEVRSECSILREEFGRLTAKDDATFPGVSDRNSTKILEEILIEVKAIQSKKLEMDETKTGTSKQNQESNIDFTGKSQDDGEAGDNGNEEYSESSGTRVTMIEALSQDSYHLERLTELKKRLTVPAIGVTMRKNARQDLLDAGIPLLKGSVIVSNYTIQDLSFGFAFSFSHSGRLAPELIRGRTQEIIRYRYPIVYVMDSPVHDSVGYKIGSTDVWLYLSYILSVKGTNGFCSLALTNKRVSLHHPTMEQIVDGGSFSRMEHKILKIQQINDNQVEETKTLGNIVVTCNNVSAMGSLIKYKRFGLQLQIDLMENRVPGRHCKNRKGCS